MQAFNNLRIGRKFAVGFAVVVAIVVAMGVSVFISLARIHTAIANNDRMVAQLNAAADVLSAQVERQNAIRGYAATLDPSFPPRLADFDRNYDKALGELERLAPEDRATTQSIRQQIAAVISDEDAQMLAARDPARRGDMNRLLLKTGRLTDLRNTLATFRTAKAVALAKWSRSQDDSQAAANLILLAGGVISALLSALMGWLLSRAVARPIGAMTDAMQRLAAGDNTVEVPAVGRRDEVGSMAGAVQTFKDAAIEKLRLEKEAADQHVHGLK